MNRGHLLYQVIRFAARLRWIGALVVGWAWPAAAAAAPTEARPPLLFREDWAEIPAATPVTQAHVTNPEVLVTRHGPAEAQIKKSHHDTPADDPYYIWSGDAERNWALSLRLKTSAMDLTGPAKIRWRAKQTGFRQLRLIVKLADGKWMVSDQSDDESTDWRIREFTVSDLRWRILDIKKVSEGKWEPKPDLSRVEEIGWTDLMSGGGTPASSRVDWIEVYAKKAPRS